MCAANHQAAQRRRLLGMAAAADGCAQVRPASCRARVGESLRVPPIRECLQHAARYVMPLWQAVCVSNAHHRKEIESMMAIVVNGDACKAEDVEKAFTAIDGVDAVVSTIGGTTADPIADSQARCRNPAHFAASHGSTP